MNGWVKKFAVGLPEVGSDEAIAKHCASWSKGRLDSMTGVEIYHHDTKVIQLDGVGVYHQSDDYEVSMLHSTPTLLCRRLQYQLPRDKMLVLGNHNKYIPFMHINMNGPDPFSLHSNGIEFFTDAQKDKWLTIEYDVNTREIKLSIEEGKL